jgi:ubiquinone/menaquinone biosynthesis C-methylase UbiE
MRWSSVWVFNLGSDVYDWFTSNPEWRGSCERLAERLPANGRLRVVDLGCGPGGLTAAIASARSGARVVGVDLARRMLLRARRRTAAGEARQRVCLVQADALHLPLADGSADAVTGHSFLYLLVGNAARAAALAEARRVLRTGGRLVLMEPHERPTPPGRILRYSRDPRHLLAVSLWRPFSRLHGRFSAESLLAALNAAGFANCGVEETIGGLGLLATGEKRHDG